jgi:hypothetical protein
MDGGTSAMEMKSTLMNPEPGYIQTDNAQHHTSLGRNQINRTDNPTQNWVSIKLLSFLKGHAHPSRGD